MSTERTEAEVLAAAAAQADERRRLNEERVAAMESELLSDLLRGRLGAQVARRARERGQLDLGGGV